MTVKKGLEDFCESPNYLGPYTREQAEALLKESEEINKGGERMKKYVVLRREVHVSHVEVEAESPEEAKEKVFEGEGDEVFLEYSHTLDSCTWTVEEWEKKTGEKLEEEVKDGDKTNP